MERFGYRRPFALAAYRGMCIEARAERVELLRLVVQVLPAEPFLTLKTKLRQNMTASGMELQCIGIPVAPTLDKLDKGEAARKQVDDYRVIIPSYDRPQQLKAKTLALLSFHGVPIERIFIFLADKKELHRYSIVLGSKWIVRTSPKAAKAGFGNLVVGALESASSGSSWPSFSRRSSTS